MPFREYRSLLNMHHVYYIMNRIISEYRPLCAKSLQQLAEANDTTDDVRTRQPAAARADGHSRFGGSTGGSTCAAPDRSILAQGPDGGWWQSLPSRPSPRQPPAPPGLAHGRRDLPPSRPPAAAADPAGATAMGGRYDVGIRSRSSLPSSRSSVQQPPAVLASSHTWRRHRRGS